MITFCNLSKYKNFMKSIKRKILNSQNVIQDLFKILNLKKTILESQRSQNCLINNSENIIIKLLEKNYMKKIKLMRVNFKIQIAEEVSMTTKVVYSKVNVNRPLLRLKE